MVTLSGMIIQDTIQESVYPLVHQGIKRFEISQKLYRRTVELAVLLAAFNRVAERERNDDETWQPEKAIENSQSKVEMILVPGYAGIKKLTFVQELRKSTGAKCGHFVCDQFDQSQCNISSSVIAYAPQHLVQRLLSKTDEQLQQWRSRLFAASGCHRELGVGTL